VGPDASRAENAGTIALAVAGAVFPPLLAPQRSGALDRLVLGVLGADLWGGAWANNTPSCVRWYERGGQGVAEHLRFAALHLHPFVIAWLNHNGCHAPWWVRGAAQYGYLVVATMAIARLRGAKRRIAGLIGTAGGMAVGRALDGRPGTAWFASVYYVKLLLGGGGSADDQ
jgi:hypothetical protein